LALAPVFFKVVSATWIANIIWPLLTATVAFHPPFSMETAKVAILLAAVPSGFFGILFAVNYRLDSATTLSMVTGDRRRRALSALRRLP
jgi:malonate transporter